MSASPARRPTDHIVIWPDERLDAVTQVIRAAEHRLLLSIFKCNEPRILEELGLARGRGVEIEAILTARASGRRRKLRRLRKKLDRLGVVVHEPRDPEAKYHAKYVVADSRVALIASLNFTRKCFRRSCDFLLSTSDSDLVSGVQRLFDYDARHQTAPVMDDLMNDGSSRLIVSPDGARERIRELLTSARERIAIIDPKLTDVEMITLLRQKLARGVQVEVLGHDNVGRFSSHGKLLIVDDRVAVIGSLSLSPSGLDERRELAALVTDPEPLAELTQFFRMAAQHVPPPLPEVHAAFC
ncbi:MAG: hypothetical protein HYZ58_06725 [Acidobacteria bacterium]|nr:hypothetical protein [Acidobacteriota bacterium]MBI3262827.1 hypothetical protein [Acidobacteriota bacterium]